MNLPKYILPILIVSLLIVLLTTGRSSKRSEDRHFDMLSKNEISHKQEYKHFKRAITVSEKIISDSLNRSNRKNNQLSFAVNCVPQNLTRPEKLLPDSIMQIDTPANKDTYWFISIDSYPAGLKKQY